MRRIARHRSTVLEVNLSRRARADERLVYTVTEAAALLGISRAHGYDLVASGELPHLRLGRRIVIPINALAQLLGLDGSEAFLSARRGGEL